MKNEILNKEQDEEVSDAKKEILRNNPALLRALEKDTIAYKKQNAEVSEAKKEILKNNSALLRALERHDEANEHNSIINSNEQTSKNGRITILNVVIMIVGAMGLVLFIVAIFMSVANPNPYVTRECDLCVKTKECKSYQIIAIDGYDEDGSYKFTSLHMHLCRECSNEVYEGSYANRGWLKINES